MSIYTFGSKNQHKRDLANFIREFAEAEVLELRMSDEDWIELAEALEKQIPKKPTNICIRCGFVVEGLCSTCGSAVLPEHKYCSNCGQTIDWSDEE